MKARGPEIDTPIQNLSRSSLPLLTDTHTHICDRSFDSDRREVLDRGSRAGVGAIIAVGEDMADAQKNLELAREFPMLKPGVGLYPTHLDIVAAEEIVAFVRANRQAIFAIGEVGLDFWMVKSDEDRELQKEIFSRFIALSIEVDLPLNVHSRSAGRHAVDVLIKNGAKRVQMHAFDGKIAAARPAVEAGYFFSIPPSIVRSRQKQKLVYHLPLECLLVETDSPVLGPEPDKRNEPANLVASVRAISEIKNVSEERVVKAVAENTQRLYGF